jgi:hypothetical protein
MEDKIRIIKLERAWDSGCEEKDFLRLFGDDGVNFYRATLRDKGDNFRFIDAEWEEYYKKRPKKEPTDPAYRQWLGLDGPGKQARTIIAQVNSKKAD